jgi:hypothetical protein
MGWNTPRRPKISTKLSYPNPREGGDGDIQVRQTNLGAKLFGKVGGTWYGAPLTGTAGDPVTRIGTNLSNHLSIDRDSIDIFTDKVKVASFGATTIIKDLNVSGKIVTEGGATSIMLGVDNGSGKYNIGIGDKALQDCSGNDSSNIGIGTNAGKEIKNDGGSYPAGNICIGADAGNSITIGDNNIAIGKSSDCSSSVNNQIAIGYAVVTDAQDQVRIGDSGEWMEFDFSAGGGTQSWSSDVRVKKDISDTDLGLEFINILRPVKYISKNKYDYPEEFGVCKNGERPSDPTKVQDGLIAQEVKAAMDELDVTFSGWVENKNTRQRLDFSRFTIPLIKAVQELSAKLDTMQTEINNLK